MKNKTVQYWLSIAVFSVSVFLTGCGPVHLYPHKSDYDAVARGQKSVVLIGLRTTWNGVSTEPFDEFTSLTSQPLKFAIASFDEDTGLKKQDVFEFGEPDGSNTRWGCFFLPPGSYYLWGYPATFLARDIQFPIEQVDDFWFQILPGCPVQYVGTLQFDMTGSQFLMEKFYRHFSCTVSDERQAASSFAATELTRFGGKAEVSLMCPYGRAIPPSNSIFPTLVAVHATDTLDSPDWKKRAMEKAFGPARWVSGGASGYGAIGALGFAIIYSPIGYTLGSSWAAEDIEKWQPCIEALHNQLVQMPPDRTLRQQIAKEFGDRAVIAEIDSTGIKDGAFLTDQNHCNSLLLADIQRVQLRECADGTFCVELVTRIRLWNPRTSRYLFDGVFLYTNPDGLFDEVQSCNEPQYNALCRLRNTPYERVVPVVSPNFSLDEYCGVMGRKHFADELDKAIEQTVRHFIKIITSF